MGVGGEEERRLPKSEARMDWRVMLELEAMFWKRDAQNAEYWAEEDDDERRYVHTVGKQAWKNDGWERAVGGRAGKTPRFASLVRR